MDNYDNNAWPWPTNISKDPNPKPERPTLGPIERKAYKVQHPNKERFKMCPLLEAYLRG